MGEKGNLLPGTNAVRSSFPGAPKLGDGPPSKDGGLPLPKDGRPALPTDGGSPLAEDGGSPVAKDGGSPLAKNGGSALATNGGAVAAPPAPSSATSSPGFPPVIGAAGRTGERPEDRPGAAGPVPGA